VPGETAKIWVNAGGTCIAALTARAAAAVIGLDQRFRMMTSSVVIVRVLMRQGTRNAGQWSKARRGICGAAARFDANDPASEVSVDAWYFRSLGNTGSWWLRLDSTQMTRSRH
jgi:hypothetical protein